MSKNKKWSAAAKFQIVLLAVKGELTLNEICKRYEVDVYSRYVVGWSLSNTLETSFCIDALKTGCLNANPEIINSDQGCQFTSEEWINYLREQSIQISMTGKGRRLDNVYIERFWRSFKREEFYLNEHRSIKELQGAVSAYIEFYNQKRWHQSLGYKRPAEVYLGEVENGKPTALTAESRLKEIQRSA